MVSAPPVFSGMMAAKLARPIGTDADAPNMSRVTPAGRAESVDEAPTARQGNREPGGVNSLRGAKAALRHAITELLFFSSIGDLVSLQRVCKEFNLNAGEANDYDRRTPLHLAAAEGCFSVVEWLLRDAKVFPNPVDRFSRTPLEDAVRGDCGDVARVIQQHGGKVYLEEEQELVPLESTSLYMFVQSFSRCGEDDEDLELQPEWEIDRRELQLMQVVGEGEFGTVHLGSWLGATVAIKVLKGSTAVAVGDFRTECHVLQKIHHPHAVQFLGACTRELPYMIVTEFLPGGSLSDFFRVLDRDPQRAPSLRRSVTIALDCAKGLRYMHARRKHIIVHRDLKPANIMLGGIPTDVYDREVAQRYGTAKIADFGLSKSLALRNAANSHRRLEAAPEALQDGNLTSELYQLTGQAGSYRYMAPEVFRREPYNSAVDVYAFAMIAYELFEGRIPFGRDKPILAAQRAAMDHQRPVFGTTNRWGKKLPPELKALVQQCWAPAARDRPDMAECVRRLEAVLPRLPPDKKKKGCTIM